ncbi:MAG TPA: peptide MFS transporter [Thermoanaerobaculia bacterium]|nr:peptide MFS transporter [Thermoanaerobaculia bacterium]
MATRMTSVPVQAVDAARAVHGADRHPKGLYVLFFTEMWERFSFYTVGGMWALYVQNSEQGFGWPQDRATGIWAWYLAFVYASPLIGGLIADRKLGYRKSVMLGGLFFMAGHALLAMRSVPVMFAALACLVVGNGFFKPNVSAMVGNLYPEGSHLKDRAYNIFYMGINIGAFLAPVVAELMVRRFGYHPAFFMGALGMVISVAILWFFKRDIEAADRPGLSAPSSTAATAVDAPPKGISQQRPIDLIPDSRRVMALIVIFLIVIVFWMVFHQNQTTWTYWANDNTDWEVSGIISNAINPAWVILLTFPLIGFWGWLDRRGKEPSTPTKMAIGMCLTGAAYFVMYLAGKAGGDVGRVSPWWLISAYGVLTLGELMLSPMGLSLVSKVAPIRLRGLMMGGWFLATAIGNKLTGVGVYWDDMLHSQFFAMLGGLSLFMAVVLTLLLKPLKKAMPGV